MIILIESELTPMYNYRSIYLSNLSNLSIYLSVCLSNCLSMYLSIYPSICLSVLLSIYLSVCLSCCLSIYHQHPHRWWRRQQQQQQQQQLYSTGWALASSSKCRQWPLSRPAASQFLQSSFLTPSCTLSIHLHFGQSHPRWPPGFIHNIFLGNLLSSIHTTWNTFYYINYIWFIVRLF